MFHEVADEPGELTPEELYALYEAELEAVIEELGVETVIEQSSLDAETVEALAAGDSPELTLEEAAAVLALAHPDDAETIVLLARDALLMDMTNAIVDVEALSAGVDGELEPREIQAKVEGRYPITMREFARIHQFLHTRIH
ncbi:DUF5791 family protein [Natronomonas sp. EA1]|uniref:DUF5791 family protein n=1 Tax=Natronomonas sp. EA1 TaxID=3421655 RepID=UPI003EB7058D